jgi:hypothetical protein
VQTGQTLVNLKTPLTRGEFLVTPSINEIRGATILSNHSIVLSLNPKLPLRL